MTLTLLIFAVILIICILLSKITHKLGVPSLLLFILLGMLMGSDGVFKVYFNNYHLTEQVCTITLIFIIFYGGFGTNWKMAKPVLKPALLLSTLGVILTAVITGLFCHFVLQLDWIESLLIGSVISSTDAASVFSILRSKKLNLKNGTASLLELESGSNDPVAYMLTLILIDLMNESAQLSEIPFLLLAQVGYGTVFGIVIGLGTSLILKKINFMVDGLETIFVLAIAILSFALPTLMGGNGYLATYLTGIIIGNHSISNKVTLVHFFDGLTGLAQILIFFILGLLSFPSQMSSILLPSFGIFIWLTFIARPLAIFFLLPSCKYTIPQKLLLSWSGLRGAASIVFAILVVLNTNETSYDIFHISFCICLMSVAVQGTLLPTVARKLNMIDDNDNVLKTFTDYQEEEHLPLIKILITTSHSWANQKIHDLHLNDTLILMLRRNEQTLIPNGNTLILPGDEVVISGTSYEENPDLTLTEIYVDHQTHPWLGKTLKDLNLPSQSLIILIKRQDGTNITPKGETTIQLHDTVILTCETCDQCVINL
ncbi:potassium/proton antiporter [Turicibacter sp. TJ11]|uniref:potassium/proton antiporter n=1 Tax=Turicibacter sp. TJ11 TaxID=2806443 RepID=UPI001F4300CA|nr:potassium/proton antiporter [Turicibacter sp. TJ11]